MTLALRLEDAGLALASPVNRGFSNEARVVASLATSVQDTPSISGVRHQTAALEALRAALTDARAEGRPSVQPDAFLYALQLLSYLTDETPLPEIAVDVDGDVALDWDEGPRRVFSVRVSRDGTLYYAGLDGQAVFHGSELLRAGVPSTISAGIERVVSQP